MTLRGQGREADLGEFLQVPWPGVGSVAWHFVETVGLDSLVVMRVADGPLLARRRSFGCHGCGGISPASHGTSRPLPSDLQYIALTEAINASPFTL